MSANAKQNKTSNKKYVTTFFFCIGQLLLDMGCSPSVVDMPSGTLLAKTDICFTYRYQLQIVSFSGVGGILCPFPLSVLEPLWLEPAQALCMLP